MAFKPGDRVALKVRTSRSYGARAGAIATVITYNPVNSWGGLYVEWDRSNPLCGEQNHGEYLIADFELVAPLVEGSVEHYIHRELNA